MERESRRQREREGKRRKKKEREKNIKSGRRGERKKGTKTERKKEGRKRCSNAKKKGGSEKDQSSLSLTLCTYVSEGERQGRKEGPSHASAKKQPSL